MKDNGKKVSLKIPEASKRKLKDLLTPVQKD